MHIWKHIEFFFFLRKISWVFSVSSDCILGCFFLLLCCGISLFLNTCICVFMLDMENDLVFFALDMFGEEKAVLCFVLNAK